MTDWRILFKSVSIGKLMWKSVEGWGGWGHRLDWSSLRCKSWKDNSHLFSQSIAAVVWCLFSQCLTRVSFWTTKFGHDRRLLLITLSSNQIPICWFHFYLSRLLNLCTYSVGNGAVVLVCTEGMCLQRSVCWPFIPPPLSLSPFLSLWIHVLVGYFNYTHFIGSLFVLIWTYPFAESLSSC